MKKIFYCIVVCSSFVANSQIKLSEKEINIKIDSIQKEANLLYGLENAAWKGSDAINSNYELKQLMGHYIAYTDGNDFVCSMISNDGGKSLTRFIYDGKTGNFKKEDDKLREISSLEKELINAKNSFIEQVSSKDYEIVIPKDFSLNIVPIKISNGYKIYVITGSNDGKIIPFGNDYLFYLNTKNEIVKYNKLHKSFIPTNTKQEGDKLIVSCMHSHVLDYPFISATDICTFKLYSPFNNLEEFHVLSTALNGIFTYNLKSNSIEFKKRD